MYKRTENIVELDDALSFTGPLSFNMMFKPAGSLCNLDCRYCYYLDKSEIYGGREPRMSLEMLEKAVKLGKAVVIDAIIPTDDKVYPMVAPGASISDMIGFVDMESLD